MVKKIKIRGIFNRILVLLILCCLMALLVSCDKADDSTSEESVIQSGEVDSPDEFINIGLYIDIKSPKISEISYRIEDNEIAVVSFIYNGLECELRGSCKYKGYDLAKVENTSDGDMLSTSINGYGATYYTLNPGRIVFWSDEHINYSLYTYVTTLDDVVKEITEHIIFQDYYNSRADVTRQTIDESESYAKQIITIFQNKDMENLSKMISYPQQLGEGQSAANIDEFMNIPPEEIFTDILLKALSEESLNNLRTTEDGKEFIIGTNYKNVHFKKVEDGKFLITKINN